MEFINLIVLETSGTQSVLNSFVYERAGTIILVSAMVDPQKEAERLNIDHWIRKPFSPEQLLSCLRQSRVNHAVRQF